MLLHEETPLKNLCQEELNMSSLNPPRRRNMKILIQRISIGERNAKALPKAQREIEAATLLSRIIQKLVIEESPKASSMYLDFG